MSSSSVQIRSQSSNSTQDVSSHTSPDSASSGMNFDIVRCSRCQRSLSLENESSPGVVRFGMNSYYCSRCASMVGFIRWKSGEEKEKWEEGTKQNKTEREKKRHKRKRKGPPDFMRGYLQGMGWDGCLNPVNRIESKSLLWLIWYPPPPQTFVFSAPFPDKGSFGEINWYSLVVYSLVELWEKKKMSNQVLSYRVPRNIPYPYHTYSVFRRSYSLRRNAQQQQQYLLMVGNTRTNTDDSVIRTGTTSPVSPGDDFVSSLVLFRLDSLSGLSCARSWMGCGNRQLGYSTGDAMSFFFWEKETRGVIFIFLLNDSFTWNRDEFLFFFFFGISYYYSTIVFLLDLVFIWFNLIQFWYLERSLLSYDHHHITAELLFPQLTTQLLMSQTTQDDTPSFSKHSQTEFCFYELSLFTYILDSTWCLDTDRFYGFDWKSLIPSK